jgi:hypothetical protein
MFIQDLHSNRAERADAGHRAGLVQAAVVAVKEFGMGREEFEHFGEAARREAVIAADARASSRWMSSARPFAARIPFATFSDFSRLTGPPSVEGACSLVAGFRIVRHRLSRRELEVERRVAVPAGPAIEAQPDR